MIRSIVLASLVAVAAWQLGAGVSVQAKAWLGQILLERAWDRADDQSDEKQRTGHAMARCSEPSHCPAARSGTGHRSPGAGRRGYPRCWPGDPVWKPGRNGHRMIAAHRDTHFRFLQHVQDGERFELELAGGQTEQWEVV